MGDGPELPALDDDIWELYDTNTDWSQAHDLAAEQPEKLAELQQLFLDEARKYNVLPLDDRRVERFNSDLAGRPTLVHGNSQLLFGGMGRLTENSVLNIKNKSHAVTAEIVVPEGGAEGVIDRAGRRVRRLEPLPRRTASPTYCYNLLGLQRFKVDGRAAIPAGDAPGAHGVRLRRRRARQGRHRQRCTSTASRSARAGSRRRVPMVFSADETADVGCDTGSPVSDDYTARASVFTGTVEWVQIDLDEAAEDVDHLITPEERLRVAMARQ